MEQSYDGAKLTPLFWSEVSSSYMIHNIFESHHDIAGEFLKKFVGIDQVEIIKIDREFPLPEGAGSVDLLIQAKKQESGIYVLIEVKIHDYSSARMEQLRDYYQAALKSKRFEKGIVYFIYLTQFSKQNFPLGKNVIAPETLEVFASTQKNAGKFKDNFKHINWEEFHAFMSNYEDRLWAEDKLILGLQKQWIIDQCKSDIAGNTVIVGERNIGDYFSDLDINIAQELDFGEHGNKQGVETYRIDLAMCDTDKLNRVLALLKKILTSRNIDQKASMQTKELTLKAVKDFLEGIVKEPERWKLLSFYAIFFSLNQEYPFLKLYGTGANGFSLKVKIREKGEISLCTLWCNNKDVLEFLEKR